MFSGFSWAPKLWVLLLNLDWLIQTSSVQLLNFCHWLCILNYLPLSYHLKDTQLSDFIRFYPYTENFLKKG